MTEKKLQDIHAPRSHGKIHIKKEFPIKISKPSKEKGDIDTGRIHSLIVERKKKVKKWVLDLTGYIKEQVVWVQPDIRWPDHTFSFIWLLKSAATHVKDLWSRLPLWASWSLGLCIVCTATILFLFVFQYRLTSATYKNYFRLFSLSESQNIREEIQDIASDFASLRRNFQIVNLLGNNPFVSNQKIKAAHYIIDGGTELALALDHGYEFAIDAKEAFWNAANKPLTDWLENKKGAFGRIANNLVSAKEAYDKIDVNQLWDEALAKTFLEKKRQLDQAANITQYVHQNYEEFLDLIGRSQPKNILILNQNQDELRAGWGFPGSAAMLTLYKWFPESWDMRDIYAFDWPLLAREVPPEGINRFRAAPWSDQSVNFGIRDANYYPTFEESAHKINALMQQAGFGSVDLVIGINQSLITDILESTGPITVESIEHNITGKNFTTIISSLVESKTYAVNSPKDILFSFAEELIDELKQPEHMGSLANIFYDQLREGEILAAATDEEKQSILEWLKLFEQWRYDKGDWIYPIFTSISKNKSDRHMERVFTVNQEMENTCARTITITQIHAYDLQTDIQIERLYYDLGITSDLEALKHVQGKWDNSQYMRLLLPAWSSMIADGGFDIQEERWDTFTQLSWYQTTRTGTTSQVSFRYEVPDHLCQEKTWMYKQPWLERVTYTLTRPEQEKEIYEF